MIYIKNLRQIEKMRIAGAKLYEVLQELQRVISPGMTTAQLDNYAYELIRKQNAIPSFLEYHGYPATLCTSINEQVVHGIPDEKTVLKQGDVLSVDCGLSFEGWHADSAFTVGIGEISPQAQTLIADTEKCFWIGARMALAGNRIGDIGQKIQEYAQEEKGYGVVKALTGHGIGRSLHEDPSVPNFGKAGHGVRMRKGMTICIEPMITTGTWMVDEMPNEWTYSTTDQSLASHYEHTILINEQGLPEILTLPGFTWEEDDHEA
ncbi:MAG: type I methionyl aminopeptidase [Clostridiales bacterium]|nr:type I methionyl aminopeptidase [Clostridiales bacterium]